MARRIRLDLIVNDVGAGVAQDWPGGDGVFYVSSATFGGGNVGVQFQAPDGNWIPIINYATTTPISLTVVGMGNFRAPAGKIRAVPTTATAVFAGVVGVPQNVAG